MPDQATKCASCVGLYVQAVKDKEEGVLHDGKPIEELPEITDCVTWLPSWQQQMVMGQMIVACVSLPACVTHCGIKEDTPAERATASGLALPGTPGFGSN